MPSLRKGKRFLEMNGIQYNLSKWVTLKEYTRRHGLESTSVVSNWISRGIVPPENIVVVSELNDLKLIKDIPYKETA